jgi:hypothetical protein
MQPQLLAGNVIKGSAMPWHIHPQLQSLHGYDLIIEIASLQPYTVNRSVQLSGPLDAVCRMKKSFTCCSAIYHCASWHRQRLLCGDISLLVHKHSTPLR